jgi:hypothetical protein
MRTPLTRFIVTLALACGAAVGGCAGPHPETPPAPQIASTIEQNGKFAALVGPAEQHADSFLGVPDTNFYRLRSLIDRRTGETSHQIYVAYSYFGADKKFDAARDGAGTALRFIPISHNEITCENGTCSYAEEFAAALPESLLRASANGLSVTFTAHSKEDKMIAVPGPLIAAQLAAVDAARAALPTPAPAGGPATAAPPPATPSVAPPSGSAVTPGSGSPAPH